METKWIQIEAFHNGIDWLESSRWQVEEVLANRTVHYTNLSNRLMQNKCKEWLKKNG